MSESTDAAQMKAYMGLYQYASAAVMFGVFLGDGSESSGVSLRSVALLQMWPASVCQALVGQREGEGGGTKCSSVPKTPHTLPSVFVAQRWRMSGAYQSYFVMWGGVVSLYLGCFGPLYDSARVLTEDGGC